MSYTISPGIAENQLAAWLTDAGKRFGTFPDGRVDYTHADIAPTVMCTVVHNDHILLVKRAHGLADADGYWSTINGFIDEIRPVAEQATTELSEELSLTINPASIRVAPSYTLANPLEKRHYIVFPCLIELTAEPIITLNAENTDFAWTTLAGLSRYHMLDDLPYAINAALALRAK